MRLIQEFVDPPLIRKRPAAKGLIIIVDDALAVPPEGGPVKGPSWDPHGLLLVKCLLPEGAIHRGIGTRPDEFSEGAVALGSEEVWFILH